MLLVVDIILEGSADVRKEKAAQALLLFVLSPFPHFGCIYCTKKLLFFFFLSSAQTGS